MAGISICPEIGTKVVGKHGEYLVKSCIGSGGNGDVFEVDIISGGNSLPPQSGYAIKFLTVSKKDETEAEKRKARFKKEIQKVILFQNKIKGVLPIYDSSILIEIEQQFLWYLMPKAGSYNPRSYSVLQKLEQMLSLGKCIKQLHELGYAHRDIKPKNLLVLEGKVYLADFGLIWNIDDTDEHITEVNDRLGPQAIRPPELQPVEKIDGVDYRKSDVYLYAKTIWMVLQCDNRGFPSEYSRTADDIYIAKERFDFETAEPLHCLMEEATKHNYWDRTDIETCIQYIEKQIMVVKGDISQDMLLELKYLEETKRIDATVACDEKKFKDAVSILKIFDAMSGIVELAFFDIGREYFRCPLRKAVHIQNNVFQIEIQNPYNAGRKKTIELAIDNICMKKDIGYEIQLSTYGLDNKSVPVFTNIIAALENSSRNVCLNAEYLIRMVR